jgi:vacuolar-type H+-ATPase subunit H
VSETPDQRPSEQPDDPPTADEPAVEGPGGEETRAMDPVVEQPPGGEESFDAAIPERLTPDPDTFSGLARGPADPPPRVRAEFPVVFRGYDREVVDAHLAALEEDMHELHATRTPQAAVRRELDRVGQETSAILQRAHESADEVSRRARTRADARIDEAGREAERIHREAEARLKQIDKDTDEVWAERRRLLEDVRATGEALIRTAEQALERFPPAEDGGPPVEAPPRRPPAPEPVARRVEELPSRRLEEVPPPDEDVDPSLAPDASIESVRRIPRPDAPTHPRFPKR